MANLPHDPLTAQPADHVARPRITTNFSTASGRSALFGLNADISGRDALEHAARTLKHTLALVGELESGVTPAALHAIAPFAELSRTLVNAAIEVPGRAGDEATARLTRKTTFFARGPEQAGFFATVAGVPVTDALEQTSCFLGSAHDLMSEAADSFGNSGAALYASGHLMEFASALIEACLPSGNGTPAGPRYSEMPDDSLIEIIERELANTAPLFGIHPHVAEVNEQGASPERPEPSAPSMDQIVSTAADEIRDATFGIKALLRAARDQINNLTGARDVGDESTSEIARLLSYALDESDRIIAHADTLEETHIPFAGGVQ